MAEIVPVTYNSGSTISGTTQVGELAAGTSPKDYTLNPGGLIWWATPNTENNYVIAHVNPNGDQPNSQSIPNVRVGFWKTDKTDADFISWGEFISNEDGDPQTFSTGSQAKTWLNNNGYWTSYVSFVSAYTPTCVTLPIYNAFNLGAYNLEYSPTSQELYINTFYAGLGPLVLNTTNNVFLGYLPVVPASSDKAGDLSIDLVNNKLYDGSVNSNYVSKYSLSGLPVSGRTIEVYATPYPSTNNNFGISYNSVNNRLYVANNDDNTLYVLDGTNLSTITGISITSPTNVSTNTTNGNFLVVFPPTLISGSYKVYPLYNGTTNELINYGSTTGNTWVDGGDSPQYSPISNKFYAKQYMTNFPDDESIIVIDGNTGTFIKEISLPGNNNPSTYQSSSMYDPLRNYIWTSTRDGNWCIIDCATDQIISQFVENSCVGSTKAGVYSTYDSINDFMWVSTGQHSIKYYDLSQIVQ